MLRIKAAFLAVVVRLPYQVGYFEVPHTFGCSCKKKRVQYAWKLKSGNEAHS